MVQWLGHCASNAGARVQSLVRELDPMCCHWRSHVVQSLSHIRLFVTLFFKIRSWETQRGQLMWPSWTVGEQRKGASTSCQSDSKARLLTTILLCPFRRYPEHYHLWAGSGPRSPPFPGRLWWDKEHHTQTCRDAEAESEMRDPDDPVTGEQGVTTLLGPPSRGGLVKLRRLDHQPPTVSQDCVEDSVTPIALRLNFSLVGEPARNYGGLRPVLAVDALRLFTALVSREDPLEQARATHSSILAWRIPQARRAWRAAVHGVPKSRRRLSN